VTILPLDDAVFERAIHLYGRRLDKQWSVIDCTSFVTMTDLGITQALMADHHFE